MNMDPIDNIQWLQANALEANNYNPNVVFKQELRLLETSIMTTGWVMPIIVSRDHIIIDGFHRWALSQDSQAIHKRYGGLIPAVVVDVSRPEAMMMTVRMNRAKGTHVAVRMSTMVRELIDDHLLAPEEVAQGIGATKQEVDLLHQEDVFKAKNLKDVPYSKSWKPVEKRK